MSDIYEVEKIIGKRYVQGKIEYKVKWLGYKMTECTWEPEENLVNVRDLIDKFENKNEKNENQLKSNNLNLNEYKIDNRFIKVNTIKVIDNQLYGIVKYNNNGMIEERKILTAELKKVNPFILIEFYESKLKFS
jgi:hypothetical protein